jgi:hypothetical protein
MFYQLAPYANLYSRRMTQINKFPGLQLAAAGSGKRDATFI